MILSGEPKWMIGCKVIDHPGTKVAMSRARARAGEPKGSPDASAQQMALLWLGNGCFRDLVHFYNNIYYIYYIYYKYNIYNISNIYHIYYIYYIYNIYNISNIYYI
jgi:hypothetical protein